MKAALALVNIRHFVQPDFEGQALRLPTRAAEALRCMPSGNWTLAARRARIGAEIHEQMEVDPRHNIAGCTLLTAAACLLEFASGVLGRGSSE